MWLYLLKKTDLFDGTPKKMLHVAPELCFESRFKERLGDGYLTADLYAPGAMVKMDIANKVFGQEDHVRIYGPDYVDRLGNSGFRVKVTKVNDLVQNNKAIEMGLTDASGEIYYCTK